MEKFVIKSSSLISDIKRLYLSIYNKTLDELVWVSSMVWIFWFFRAFLKRPEIPILFYILFYIISTLFIMIYLSKKRKPRHRKTWNRSFKKILCDGLISREVFYFYFCF